MSYNKDSHITTMEEVESFFDYLLLERKIFFHPDDDFADYISKETGEAIFSKDEVYIFNRLMNESFNFCKKSNVDICGLVFDKSWALLNAHRAEKALPNQTEDSLI